MVALTRAITGAQHHNDGIIMTATVPPPSALTPLETRELDSLLLWHEGQRMRAAHDKYPKALNYLAAVGIGPLTAFDLGIGYVPPVELKGPINRWRDRIIFPIDSPNGKGFFGFSLDGWEVGMGPGDHLWQFDGQASQRNLWEHSGHPGWFNTAAMKTTHDLIVVQDLFDAALIAQWLPMTKGVVAIDGFSFYPDWLPQQLRTVTLAYEHIDSQLAELVRRGIGRPSYAHIPSQAGTWTKDYLAEGYDGLAPLVGAWELPIDPCAVAASDVICQQPVEHSARWALDNVRGGYRCPACPR